MQFTEIKNMPYMTFMELAADTMSKWKSANFIIDKSDPNYMFNIWAKIYYYLIGDEIDSYFYTNSIRKKMYNSINKKFTVIKFYTKSSKINHYDLKALMDPLNSYRLEFEQTESCNIKCYTKMNVFSRLKTTNVKVLNNNSKNIIKLNKLLLDEGINETDIESMILKLIRWYSYETMDYLYLRYLKYSHDKAVRYVVTDVEMFYTDRLISFGNSIKLSDIIIKDLKNIESFETDTSKNICIKNAFKTFYNIQLDGDDKQFSVTDTGLNLQEYLKSITKETENKFTLNEKVIKEFISYIERFRDKTKENFNNVYNYDIIEDAADYIFSKDCPAEPGYFDNII